ncbi:MAG: hypothetical protein ACKN85_13160 [Pirellula sp.]
MSCRATSGLFSKLSGNEDIADAISCGFRDFSLVNDSLAASSCATMQSQKVSMVASVKI